MSQEPKPPPEILEYYALGGEQGRLDEDYFPLERVRTQELILRRLPPPPAVALDVGGGAGARPRPRGPPQRDRPPGALHDRLLPPARGAGRGAARGRADARGPVRHRGGGGHAPRLRGALAGPRPSRDPAALPAQGRARERPPRGEPAHHGGGEEALS